MRDNTHAACYRSTALSVAVVRVASRSGPSCREHGEARNIKLYRAMLLHSDKFRS